MKNIIFILLASCFSVLALDNSGNPGFPMTQPFIANGLSTAQNYSQAQGFIGINGAGVSNLVVNAITNKDVRSISLSNNLTVQSQQSGSGDGGSIWFNSDSDAGAFNGGNISISANANDINTLMGKIIISSTNANQSSGSLGEVDIFGGDLVNIYGGNSGINLDTPLGWTSANGAGITNVPASGLTGQILLSSLTNAGTLWTNHSIFEATNIGHLSTNFTYQIAQNLTNFVNQSVGSITSVLTSANVTTNLDINGRSLMEMDISKINLLNSSNSVNLVYSRVPATLTWTNAGSGFGIFSNTVGGITRFNLIDNAGNVLFFRTNSPQGQWSQNFVPTNAPTGDWGRSMNFAAGQNAEALTLTNVPASAITGIFPIATNAYVATNGIDGTESITAGRLNLDQPTFSGYSFNPSSSVAMSYGSAGRQDTAALWDCRITYSPTRKLWIYCYIGLTNVNGSGASVLIGTSSDGRTWTNGNTILQPNTNASTWWSGCLSASQVFEDADGSLLLSVAGTTNQADYFLGRWQIGTLGCAAGADPTIQANWTWNNSTNPVLGQPYNGAYESMTAGGIYAPFVMSNVGTNNYAMFYSAVTNSIYELCVAFSTNKTTGQWTRSSSNPLTSDGGSGNEVPSIVRLPNNAGFMCVADSVGYTPTEPIMWSTTDTNGVSNWSIFSLPYKGRLLQPFQTNYIGSMAIVPDLDGSYITMATVNSNLSGGVRAPKLQQGRMVLLPSADNLVAGKVAGRIIIVGSPTNFLATEATQYTTNNILYFDGGYIVQGRSKAGVNHFGNIPTYMDEFNGGAVKIGLGSAAFGSLLVLNGGGGSDLVSVGSTDGGNLTLHSASQYRFSVGSSSVTTNNQTPDQFQVLIDSTGIRTTGTNQFSGIGSGLTNLTGAGILAPYSTTPVAVTVGASPFTFSNATLTRLECQFSGSVAYSITKNGAAIYGSLAGDAYFQLAPTNVCVITYSVAPTLFTNQW